jgi:predicted GNAT family acetyltransferase
LSLGPDNLPKAQLMVDVTVSDNPETGSYDASIDGTVVGMLVYRRKGGRIIFTHTIVQEAHRGKGIATGLVRNALDDVRARGLRLTNYCTFVDDFVTENPEYSDLLDRGTGQRH